jgi:hypothetical protein
MGGKRKMSGSSKVGIDFASSSTTRAGMGKGIRQAYSAHKTGLESTLGEVLTVVESGDGGWTKIVGILETACRLCL